MEQDDYELVPHREIYELKKQLDELRSQKGLVESGAREKIEITNKELFDTMNKLIEGINAMISIFQKAAEDLGKSDEGESIRKKLEPIGERLEELEDQNRKVARAILAVSESVKSQFGQLSEDMSRKLDALAQRPPMPPMPMQMEQSPYPPMGMPPPPVPPPTPPSGY